MKTLKVLSIEINWLLCRGFTRLLGDEFDINMVECGIVDFQKLILDISYLEPDLILSSDSSTIFVKTLLEPIQKIFPSLHVIVVEENSNWLNIYSGKIIKPVHVLELKKLLNVDWQVPILSCPTPIKKNGDVQNRLFSSKL